MAYASLYICMVFPGLASRRQAVCRGGAGNTVEDKLLYAGLRIIWEEQASYGDGWGRAGLAIYLKRGWHTDES